MAAQRVLRPGAAHPHAPTTVAGIAETLRVADDQVAGWIDEGLPVGDDGLIDPFAVADWLAWGRLDRCPALERRWRTWLRWFLPHLAGEDGIRRIRVDRRQRLCLPAPAAIDWHVPTLPDGERQRVVTDAWDMPAEVGMDGTAHHRRLRWSDPVGAPSFHAQADVEVAALRPMDDDDHRRLVAEVVAVAADFRYEYRHHDPGETADPPARAAMRGSCLDCALALGRRFTDRGRPWRLITGVIAHDAVANPHFWLEVDSLGGWRPVDPTIPAIARMLGADWRWYAAAYAGGCDARRVTLAIGTHPVPGLPFAATVGSSIGEAVADGGANAWPCLDWVCGECSWTFA